MNLELDNTRKWIPHRPETWVCRYMTVRRAITTVDGAVIPPGTRVKITMVSRLGNAGITTDLEASSGYVTRVDLGSLETDFDQHSMVVGDHPTVVEIETYLRTVNPRRVLERTFSQGSRYVYRDPRGSHRDIEAHIAHCDQCMAVADAHAPASAFR